MKSWESYNNGCEHNGSLSWQSKNAEYNILLVPLMSSVVLLWLSFIPGNEVEQ